MKTIRVIDLLNKIANGEEVPKFWWNGCIHEVQKEYGTNKYSIFDTYCKKYKRIELEDLNDEIKIIEDEPKEDKIKKVGKLNQVEDKQHLNNYILRDKINEIIDKLNEMSGDNDRLE